MKEVSAGSLSYSSLSEGSTEKHSSSKTDGEPWIHEGHDADCHCRETEPRSPSPSRSLHPSSVTPAHQGKVPSFSPPAQSPSLQEEPSPCTSHHHHQPFTTDGNFFPQRLDTSCRTSLSLTSPHPCFLSCQNPNLYLFHHHSNLQPPPSQLLPISVCLQQGHRIPRLECDV